MKKTIKYPEDRRIAISAHSFEEIREFINQIPTVILLNAIKSLPKRNGFREGKDTEIRLKLFFGKMDRWDEDEWGIFTKIWLSWTASNDHFRKLLCFRTGGELEELIEKMMKNLEVRTRIFNSLVTGEITQEVIRTWLKYSPFVIDMETQWLVVLAPTQHFKNLEKRLETLEEQMGTSINKQGELLKECIESVQGDLPMLTNSIDEIRQEIVLIHREVAQIESNFNSIEDKTTVLNNEIERLSSLKSSLSNFEHLAEQLASLNVRINERERYLNDLGSNFSRLESSINDLNSNENISAMAWEKREVQLAAAVEVVDSFIEKKITFEGEPTKLSSIENIVAHLKNNLNNLGIKLADARSVSYEIFCAVLSNQLVMFSGSMSMMVAEYCAASLSGHAVKVVKVPIGKTGDLVSEERIEAWLSETELSGYPVAIIFEGINRSAFEIYGSNLKKFIADRIVGLKNEKVPIIFFATLLEGPSVLSLSKELLDIGPVFNTDYLGWSYKNITPSIPGTIDLSRLTRKEMEINDYLELDDLLPSGIIEHSSVLWRKTLTVTYRTMIQLNPSFDFASINFGWLIPMTLLKLPNHVGQLFDEIELDERCKALIKHMATEV